VDLSVDGSANRMYDFSDDIKFNWGEVCDKNNPDEIKTINRATLYLTDTKYSSNGENIIIDIPSTANQEDKIEAVVRFIKQNVTPMQVGIQQNTCDFISASVSEWTEWSSCSQECGGRSDRFRVCTTNNGQIFTWNGDWVDQNGDRPNSCYCTVIGGESRPCVEDCTYSNWSEWGSCLLEGDSRVCRNADDAQFGSQRRSRSLLCGDESKCCGADDFKPCFVPECPGWTTWSEWSCCSKSCGVADDIGTRVRTRGCKGDDIGSEACPCGVSLDSSDSVFSDICIERSNRCENALTTGDNIGFLQTALCNPENKCPRLSDWSDWSSCDCESETESREKICTNAPYSLGKIQECMGDGKFYEERSCSDSCSRRKRSIPDFWSEWSECQCGIGHSRKRSGTINGIDIDMTEKCPQTKCSNVSEWSEWSTCSEACAQRDGVERRVRNCIHSHSSECVDDLTEERACTSVPDCPKWGNWSPWYDDCAMSNRLIRMRTCSGSGAIPHECSQNDDVEYISCANRL